MQGFKDGKFEQKLWRVTYSEILQDTNGVYYSDVVFYTTFAPGDNFRIAAIFSDAPQPDSMKKLNNRRYGDEQYEDDVPRTGTGETNDLDLKAFIAEDGKLTDELTVWRRVHIESDRIIMPSQKDEESGLDFQDGNLTSGFVTGHGSVF